MNQALPEQLQAEYDVSIIIPAYNEEGAIADTVKAIQELGLPSYELLVIDDGSSDQTASAAAEAGAKVVRHPYNIGNGAAVKTGIRSSKGKILCFMDGDGQHKPEDIPRLVELMSRYHMVIGARQRGSQSHIHRDIANGIYNILASFIAEFPIEDLTSGFRAMRREDALRFCDMFPNRFSYPTTSTLAFVRSGRSVRYIPILTLYRVGRSKIRILQDGFEFLVIIMKIAMSFSPLRIFVPLSAFLFFAGIFRYGFTYLQNQSFTNMSALVLNSSVIIFMLGLVAEQIAHLRLEKGDALFNSQRDDEYREFEGYYERIFGSPSPDLSSDKDG